jgi:histidinol phosphatase-like enzyme
MSNKGYKQLKGIRILLSLPKRDDKGIELSPELKEEMNREYATKMDKLEVYAIGDAVTDIQPGDLVYVPVEELKRGTFVTINDEEKLMVPSMSVALIW